MCILRFGAALALSFSSLLVTTVGQAPASPQAMEVFHDLGFQLGEAGQTGFGSLYPGTTMAYRLTGAAPGATVHFVIGFTRADTPTGAGTLVPSSDLLITMVADASGNADVERLLRSTMPFGKSFYAQWITDDVTQPGNIGLSNAFKCRMPGAPTNGSLLYDDVMASISVASGDDIDQSLIDHIIAEEALLRANPAQLLELVTPMSKAMTLSMTSGGGSPPTSGGGLQQQGGNVQGGTTVYRNIFGGKVGSSKVTVTWGTGANGRRKITGHTGVGGILLGSVDSHQVGDLWWVECPDGTMVQRGNFQSSATQGFRWVIKQTLKSEVEVLGPPCPISA